MVDFKHLEVWHRARILVRLVYEKSAAFPKTEAYGLTSQMRRAAISVAANLAEGSERVSDTEFARFVGIARGSAAELYTHLLLATDVGLLDEKSLGILIDQLDVVRKMIFSLHRKLTTPT